MTIAKRAPAAGKIPLKKAFASILVAAMVSILSFIAEPELFVAFPHRLEKLYVWRS